MLIESNYLAWAKAQQVEIKTNMTIEEKIASGYYETKLARSTSKDKILRANINKEWMRDQSRLMQEFMKDAIEDAGLSKHPKAMLAYEKARDASSGDGLLGTLHELRDLAELML